MNLWTVWTGQYSDKSLVGIYSSKESAAAIVASLEAGESYINGPYALDAGISHAQQGHHPYRVTSYRDKGRWSKAEIERVSDAPESVEVDGQKGFVCHVVCWATDEKHAMKIAADERAKWLVVPRE